MIVSNNNVEEEYYLCIGFDDVLFRRSRTQKRYQPQDPKDPKSEIDAGSFPMFIPIPNKHNQMAFRRRIKVRRGR
jgi:hypothetical protein